MHHAIHSVQLRSAVACEDLIDASLAALREHLDIDAVSTPEMDEVGVAAALGNAKSLARDAIAALHSRSVVRVSLLVPCTSMISGEAARQRGSAAYHLARVPQWPLHLRTYGATVESTRRRWSKPRVAWAAL